MEIDTEKLLMHAIMDGLREGVKSRICSTYRDNPIDKAITETIAKFDGEVRTLLADGLKSALGDPAFRDDMKTQVRHILAKQLVSKFGDELEKQINTLKSDPTTRARITLAIEEIVASKT